MAKRNFENGRNAGKVAGIINNSNMTGNAATTVDLDISKIDENPDNENIFDMSGIDELAKEIQDFGFTGAIDVYQKEDGRYELSSGHRRFRAVKTLNWKTIPAIIKPMPSDVIRRHKLIHSNTKNRVLSYMDLSKAIQYEQNTIIMALAEKAGKSFQTDEQGNVHADVEKNLVMEELSRAFDMSVSRLYKYINLQNVIPEIIELIEQKRIPMECSHMFASKDQQIQHDIYNAFRSELALGDSDEDNPSTLNKSQCTGIIKTILRQNKEFIDGNTSTAEKKAVSAPTPTPIAFSAETGGKNDLFKTEGHDHVPQAISFSSIMDKGKKNEVHDIQPDRIDAKETTEENKKRNSQEEPSANTTAKVKEYHNYIDNTIILFTRQMSTLVENEFDVQDKEILSKSIEKLETILEQIKGRL